MCTSADKRQHKRRCSDDEDYGCAERTERGECSGGGEVLYRCPKSCNVCRWESLLDQTFGCDDTHENCAAWARSGECKANPSYMSENCAVSCNACEEKRRSCDRPPNTPPAVRAGGINATMVRILRDFPQYSPRAISWPGGPHGARAPWVVTLENFVSDEEAAAFQSTCAEHFARSLAGDTLSPVRTSSQCWCSGNACEAHELTQRVAERISNVTCAPIRYMEPFQILKYEVGQFYRVHHDQNSGLFTPQGARVYTFFSANELPYPSPQERTTQWAY